MSEAKELMVRINTKNNNAVRELERIKDVVLTGDPEAAHGMAG